MTASAANSHRTQRDGFLVARYAFGLGIVLALYASLRPFTGWRDSGRNPFAFLFAPWPAALSGWDVLLNIDGYLALGVCAVLALAPRLRGFAALLVAVLGLSVLSLCMETMQAYLPTRSPSVVDLATNALGALAGGIAGLTLVPYMLPGGALHGLRRKLFLPGAAGDAGLILLGAWFIALLAPRTLLYANGDMRLLLGVQPHGTYPQTLMLLVEAVCAVVNLVALALIVRVFAAGERQARGVLVALIAASFVVRSAAFGLFWTAQAAFQWLTPGAIAGLALGVPAAFAVMPLARRPAAAIAGLLLVLSTLIVNLAPPNPYLWLKPRPTRQHELAPLSMLSRTTAMAWPFAAVVLLGWRRTQERAYRKGSVRA